MITDNAIKGDKILMVGSNNIIYTGVIHYINHNDEDLTIEWTWPDMRTNSKKERYNLHRFNECFSVKKCHLIKSEKDVLIFQLKFGVAV